MSTVNTSSTVSTPQSPDLLLSLLMGMVGTTSPNGSGGALAGTGSGMSFAGLLDPANGLDFDSAEPAVALADAGTESDLAGGDYSAAGQLNALITAALAAAPDLSLKDTPQPTLQTNTVQNATGALSDGDESSKWSTGSSSSLLLASNVFNAPVPVQNRFFNVDSELTAAETSNDQKPLGFEQTTAVERDVNGQEFNSAITPNPASNLKSALLQKDEAALNAQPEMTPDLKAEAKSTQSRTAAANSLESDIGREAVQIESLNVAQSTASQFTTANQASTSAVGNDQQSENSLTQRLKSRGARSVERDLENSAFPQIDNGGFGSVSASSIVTAMSGTLQSRQDGLTGRGDLREELTSPVSGRASEGPTRELANPEPLPQIDLNAARTDFEQSLERVAESFPLDSVAQQIVEVAEPDSGWISVEIQPPDLGKLEIMVSKQGDDYTARIIAHEASTEEALSLQQAELLDALNQHGLELKEVQIVSDADSGSRWNLDSSNQQHSDNQARDQYSPERRDDSQSAYPAADKSNASANPVSLKSETQQVNFLV